MKRVVAVVIVIILGLGMVGLSFAGLQSLFSTPQTTTAPTASPTL